MTSGSLRGVMVAHWPRMLEMWVGSRSRHSVSHFHHTHDDSINAAGAQFTRAALPARHRARVVHASEVARVQKLLHACAKCNQGR